MKNRCPYCGISDQLVFSPDGTIICINCGESCTLADIAEDQYGEVD